MTWIAVAIVGGSLVTGYMGSNAAQGAADTQAASAAAANAQQKAMFDQTTQNVAPWLDAGKASLAQLSAGVAKGDFNPASYGAATPLGAYTGQAPSMARMGAPMQQDGVGAAAQQIGVGASPTMSSVSAPGALATYAPQAQLSMSGSVGAMQTLDPAQQLAAYKAYTAQNPYQDPGAFTADKFKQDPGYQFQLQQGLDALTNKSSLAGGMNSNNLKGLIGYAEGMANTDYQQAFGNYQTEAGRSLNTYQTGLQDYIQQFMVGQNTDKMNNDVTQQNFLNKGTVAGFNNGVTQQQYADMMATTAANNAATQQNNQNAIQTTGLNNGNITQGLANTESATGFNNAATAQSFKDLMAATMLGNQASQSNFTNDVTGKAFNNQTLQTMQDDMLKNLTFNNAGAEQEFQNANALTGANNQVIAANDANALQRAQLNNQNLQQQYANLASLSQSGMGAALQQGQISAGVGQSIGNNITGAGAAQAAGQIGGANAIAGGLGNAYNAWLQQQYMKSSGGGYGNFISNNTGFMNDQGLTPGDITGVM